MEWILHRAKFCQRARAAENSVPAQETAKHRAKFGWPPVSDVTAVTKARRETHWNLLESAKLANWSQPFIGRSSPYCGDMWRTYCCLTSFSDCRYMRQLRTHSPTKLCDGAQMTILASFLRPVFQRTTCSTFETCILNSKFALRPHHVWKYGRHPISGRWD